jgi:peptide deformylase
MAIKEIIKMGHPLLLEKAKPVTEFDTQELHKLVKDMIETMEGASGAGLAAPQVGEGIQLVIFGFEDNERYEEVEEAVPFTILINPIITPLTHETEDAWEGCLSVPGMRGLVPRFKKINYKGFDQFGKSVNRDVEGFHARVVQHECDHLIGILYPLRIKDLRFFGFEDTLFVE